MEIDEILLFFSSGKEEEEEKKTIHTHTFLHPSCWVFWPFRFHFLSLSFSLYRCCCHSFYFVHFIYLLFCYIRLCVCVCRVVVSFSSMMLNAREHFFFSARSHRFVLYILILSSSLFEWNSPLLFVSLWLCFLFFCVFELCTPLFCLLSFSWVQWNLRTFYREYNLYCTLCFCACLESRRIQKKK